MKNFLSLNPKVPHIIVLNKVDLADNGTLLKNSMNMQNLASILKLSCPILARKKLPKTTAK